jgi:glycosyltransferase involved in cell wall biosynthesis
VSREENQNKDPLISLLIPFYNVERYIEESILSAQAQTYKNLEFICINDGSTDSSRDIVAKIAKDDSRIIIIDKPNSGYGASMNRGLKTARGEYAAILESDDILDSPAIETMYNAAQQYAAEVVKANFFLYWSTPVKRDELFELVSPSMANRLVNPQEEWEIFYQKPAIWSALYRRDFLINNAVWFLETPGASYQDTGFGFKVWASATRAVYLTDAFLHYRQDNETSSVKSSSKVYCVCEEYAEIQRYLDARPDKKTYLAAVTTKMKYDSYMWNIERLSYEDKLEFLQHMSKEFSAGLENGDLDCDLLEPWKIADLNAIIDSPEIYLAAKPHPLQRLWTAIKYYKKQGGVSLVFQRIAKKIRKN